MLLDYEWKVIYGSAMEGLLINVFFIHITYIRITIFIH